MSLAKLECYMHSWVSLPEELLLLVLSHMDGQALMTMRLVCRDWRRASMGFVKSLNLNNWPEVSKVLGLDLPRATLESRLQALPNLRHVAFTATACHEPELLSVPACSAVLDSLCINYNPMVEEIRERQSVPGTARCAPFLEVELACVSRLTALTFLHVIGPVGVNVGTGSKVFGISTAQIMRHCTNLCRIHLAASPSAWSYLVEHMAALPQLRMLGAVPLHNDNFVLRLAALTQLTNLQICVETEEDYDVLEWLAELPALRRLHYTIPPLFPPPDLEPVPALSRLDELCLAVYEGFLPQAAIDAFISSSASLTALTLRANPILTYDLPPLLWQRALAKLECLIWECAALMSGPVAFSTSLKALHITLQPFGGKRDGQGLPRSPELVSGLTALTGLTWLSLAAKVPDGNWSTGSEVDATWRVATFLTALTRLTELNLQFFLHVANVETDVRCLAMLTGLRKLSLRGSCACHSGRVCTEEGAHPQSDVQQADLPEEDSSEGDDEPILYSRCPTSFLAFEQRGGFLPLLSLTALGQLTVGGPWRVLDAPGFQQPFNAMRHELGRPLLRVTVDNSVVKRFWEE